MSVALYLALYYEDLIGPATMEVAKEQEVSDAEVRLVERARTGDFAAFEDLVRTYRNEVYGLAYHFLRNREEAWDISQEVFIKTHRSLARFRGESSFKTWLMRITANQCKDYLKKRRLDAVPFNEEIETHDAPSALLGPDTTAEARELGEAITKALETLAFKHRTAFVLREFEGLSYDEMAKVMNCNIGTVMRRLHHARKKLQYNLKRMGFSRG